MISFSTTTTTNSNSNSNPADQEEVLQSLSFYLKHSRKVTIWCAFASVLLSLIGYICLSHAATDIQVSRSSFFTSSQLQQLKLLEEQETTNFSSSTRTPTNLKVIFLLVDGMRYDFAFVNSQSPMKELFLNSTYTKDLITFESRAQMPSMSYPNYVTAFTSSSPELTGVVGNNNVENALLNFGNQEDNTNYLNSIGLIDSLLFKAKESGLKCGISGKSDGGITEWWKTSLIPFKSDGFGGEFSDQFVTETILKAITTNEFDFLFMFLAEVDYIAHYHGCTGNEYLEKLKNSSVSIQKVFDTVNNIDNSTVVIIFGDHGHMNSGGHGGNEEVVMKTPVIVWKQNSNLSKFGNSTVNSLDYATIITALLGLNPPRLSIGKYFNNDIMEELFGGSKIVLRKQLQRLFIQKIRYVNFFVNVTNALDSLDFNETALLSIKDEPNLRSLTDSEAILWYKTTIDSIISLVFKVRNLDSNKILVRNSIVSSIICIILSIISIILCFKLTLCDFISLLPKYLIQNSHRKHSIPNLIGLLLSFSFWSVYYLLTIGIWLLIERFIWEPSNEWAWSMSIIKNGDDKWKHFSFILGFGFGISILLNVLFNFVVLRKYKEIRYCFNHYSVLISCLISNAILSAFTFRWCFIPGILEIKYVNYWNEEFQLICIGGFTVPMSTICIVVVFVWQYDLNSIQSLLQGMNKYKLRTSSSPNWHHPITQSSNLTNHQQSSSEQSFITH